MSHIISNVTAMTLQWKYKIRNTILCVNLGDYNHSKTNIYSSVAHDELHLQMWFSNNIHI